MKVNEIILESIIDEVEEIDYISAKKGKQSLKDPHTLADLKKLKAKVVGRLSSGHEIYFEQGKAGLKAGSTWNSYYAVSPDGQVDLALGADEKNNVLSEINLYAINPHNTLKAHNFYHFLITKLNKVLVANRQSPGGHAVWKQMQKFHKDINIHGWLRGQPVNIDMNDDEYTHAPNPGWPANEKDSQEIKDARNMKLVASKK